MWVVGDADGETGVRLELLDGEILSGDSFPDLPLRLRLSGKYAEPVDGTMAARVELRFDRPVLLDLGDQIRAMQLALATQARRAAERTAAAEVAVSGGPMADIDLLRRVLKGLGGTLPAAAKDHPQDSGEH